MKKLGKASKKGFTLVELIVVLVILAVLAAMLVPALTGYIRKARQEKEFQAASEVLVAAQAIVTEYYGTTADNPPSTTTAAGEVTVDNVKELIGMEVDGISGVVVNSEWVVTDIVVTIGDGKYTYASNAWSVDPANS